MADLEDITETPRTDIESDSNHEERGLARRNGAKRKRLEKRRNSARSQSPAQTSLPDQVLEERREECGSAKQSFRQPADSPRQKQETPPTRKDYKAVFYKNYRKVAEEYDKEFLKKHDEDLNTTLIFAGLFSAVTSAFIIQLDSQLQPDPNNETAALLRLLVYKIDNSTFGNNVPTLPQWTGPPRMIVQVQAILFASLALSLFSAFLAMLGKQWLNRYESNDVRGSAIEHGQNRQRKLGGILGWYFVHVIGSLPLMLQAGLFLLGGALSRYFWEVDIAIASVVVGVTSLGLIFYLSIVIAGTVSESCPYQTPASHLFRRTLRYLRGRVLPSLRSTLAAISLFISSCFSTIHRTLAVYRSLASHAGNSRSFFELYMVAFVAAFLSGYNLGLVVASPLVVVTATLLDLFTGGVRTAYRWSFNILPPKTPVPGQQTITMDLRCISWILRTSLDEAVHLSALLHLISMPKLSHFHPTLVLDCLKVFTRCINVDNGRVVVVRGSERLATASADGFFCTLHHLATMDPGSSFLADLQQRYNEIFPSEVDLTDLPFRSTMIKIHNLAGRFGNPRDIWWYHRRLPIQEHASFAREIAETAQDKFQIHKKVPRRILRSVLYSLSLSPVSPPSLVANCLKVVGIDLGCDVSNMAISDESARVEDLLTLITQELKTMVEVPDRTLILSKRKAMNTLLPYAIFLEQGGQQSIINAIFRAARTSGSSEFMWRHLVQ